MQSPLPSRRRASLLFGGATLLVSLLSACDTERPISPTKAVAPSAAVIPSIKGPSLNWKMIDEDSALIAVAGSEFWVTGPNSFFKWVIDNGPDDGNPTIGAMSFAPVAPGMWGVCQSQVSGNYVQMTGPCHKAMVTSGTVSVAPFFNPHPAYLSFGLADEVGNLLPGATFTLADSNGIPDGFVEDVPLYDENPVPGKMLKRIVTEDLYTLCETTPPSGFVIPAAQNCVKFQTHYGDTTVFGNMANYRPYSTDWGVTDGNLDASNNYVLLGGAKFKVYSPRSLNAIVVDDNGPNDYDLRPGRLALKLSTPGTYSVCETQAPAGHWMPTPKCMPVNVTQGLPAWTGWFFNYEAQVPGNKTR